MPIPQNLHTLRIRVEWTPVAPEAPFHYDTFHTLRAPSLKAAVARGMRLGERLPAYADRLGAAGNGNRLSLSCDVMRVKCPASGVVYFTHPDCPSHLK